MSGSSPTAAFSDQELKALRHPKEASRFILAMVFGVIGVAMGLIFVLASAGTGLLILGSAVASVWFGLSLFKAYLIGNSVKVTKDNFPEIHRLTEEVKARLGYDLPVDVYVAQGDLNALIYHLFRTKFIVLNSALVEGMRKEEERAELLWILARFVGALKAKHLHLNPLRICIDAIESIKIFNLFILPYERAIQYSGDQIGLAACADLQGALRPLSKFLVGNGLADSVKMTAMVEQIAQTQSSFFGWLAQLFSTHPHTLNRYVNLVAFCRQRYPSLYQAYAGQFPAEAIHRLEALLPPTRYPQPALTAEPAPGMADNPA